MATQIHGAGPTGQRSPGLDLAIAGYLAENGGGGGVELVSGVVDLGASGAPVREFYCTASATIEGVAFAAGTAVVFRRTPAGVWGYIVVEPWTDISGTTTTTTTAATTTTTTTAATTTTTTTAAPGTLTYRGEHATWSEVSTLTYTDAPLGDADADRWVIVMVTWWSGSNRDNTDLTIGGNAATRVYRAELTTQQGCNVWLLHVPSGATADIVATMNSAAQPSIAVWTTDAEPAFVAGANTIASASADTATVTPTSVADGFVVAGYRSRSSAALAAWTGVTERWDTGASNQPGSGGDATTPSTTHPITVDWDPAITQATRVTAATFEWV